MDRPILIIEDNDQNLYLMRFLLEKDGLLVAEARDGREGVRKAVELQPAAILLDIQLPEIVGYDVARELRRHPPLARTPIIAVTPSALPGDRERAVAAGVDDYIEKPIDPATFVGRVRGHLRGANPC